MPHPIPSHKVVPRALNYLSRRQIAGRPTTLYQFSKYIGLGGERLLGLFEREHIQYVLISYAERRQQYNKEILLFFIPENWIEALGIDEKQLLKSYKKMFADYEAIELQPLEKEYVPSNSPGDNLSPQEMIDPHAYYRINERQFLHLKDELIPVKELYRVAIENGYTYRSIYRAIGGPKMRYRLAGPMWRPYMYQSKRYFLKEVLKYLYESDLSYKNRGVPRRRKLEQKRLLREES